MWLLEVAKRILLAYVKNERMKEVFTQSETDIENKDHEMPIGASDHCVLVFDCVAIMKAVLRGREEGSEGLAFHRGKYQVIIFKKGNRKQGMKDFITCQCKESER